MKLFIFLLLILIVFSDTFGQANRAEGKIIYEQVSGKSIEYLEMWFNPSSYMYSMKQDLDKYLSINQNHSTGDSLDDAEWKEGLKTSLENEMPQTWYGELKSSLVRNFYPVNGKIYCVTDTLGFVTWDIQNDTITIEGMKCQKASGVTPKGTKIIAWFAPSIPVSVAPYTLRGLPGLLIQAGYNSGGSSVTTRMIRLEWPIKNSRTIAVPNNAIFVADSERRIIQEQYNKAALKMAEQLKKQLDAKNKMN